MGTTRHRLDSFAEKRRQVIFYACIIELIDIKLLLPGLVFQSALIWDAVKLEMERVSKCHTSIKALG